MQPLAKKISLRKSTYAAFFFVLIPSLIAGLAICFGSRTVMNWGQFLTGPPLLAMCHSLSILWVLNGNKSMWWALKLLAAFVVLVFTHATAMSLATYQYDFPVFSNELTWHAIFTAPSTILIGVMAFVAQPYLCAASLNSETKPSKHSIFGLISATATVACVMSYLTTVTINYIRVDQFLRSQLALGGFALICLWCILSRQYTVLRYTVLVTTIAALLLTTGILLANRIEAFGEIWTLTFYLLCLTGFISTERFIGFQLPHCMQIEPQNNNPLDTKPSISRFDLR